MTAQGITCCSRALMSEAWQQAYVEMSLLLGGSRAAARGGAARLRPTVVLVKT
jgi:hypothetical protein